MTDAANLCPHCGGALDKRPPLLGLTRMQRKVVLAVQAFRRAHGYGPSVEEIGAAVSLSSKGGVSRHLALCRMRGWLTGNGGARSMALTRDAEIQLSKEYPHVGA